MDILTPNQERAVINFNVAALKSPVFAGDLCTGIRGGRAEGAVIEACADLHISFPGFARMK
jgi:hypothetical protein